MQQNELQRGQPGRFMRFMQRLMPRITPFHIWMYRRLGGRFVSQSTVGAPVLVLTVKGRRSGLPRSVILAYMFDHNDIIVAGTNGGQSALPSWVHNLRANAGAEVELGREEFLANAEWFEDSVRDDYWHKLVAAYPGFEQAQQWAGRKIPLVRLRRIKKED